MLKINSYKALYKPQKISIESLFRRIYFGLPDNQKQVFLGEIDMIFSKYYRTANMTPPKMSITQRGKKYIFKKRQVD